MAKNIFNKYVWLVETIYKAGRISFEELNEKWMTNENLSEGMELLQRTFHKWRIACEEVFGLVIECDRKDGYRYYILNAREFERGGLRSWLIDTISVSNLLLSNQSLNDRILLEKIPSGKEYLSSILGAIKEKNICRIIYYNYVGHDERPHEVMPLCVKLFRQRWYMISKSCNSGKIMAFGLDRIRDFKPTDKKFEYPDDFDAQTYYDESFGIINGDGTKTEHVVLKVSAIQANYLRDLPMHHSQIETQQDDNYSIFELDIKPTFDFQQEILWAGEEMEVLAPLSFRNEIAGKIKLMWNKYKED